jgi:hypothetical protein
MSSPEKKGFGAKAIIEMDTTVSYSTPKLEYLIISKKHRTNMMIVTWKESLICRAQRRSIG